MRRCDVRSWGPLWAGTLAHRRRPRQRLSSAMDGETLRTRLDGRDAAWCLGVVARPGTCRLALGAHALQREGCLAAEIVEQGLQEPPDVSRDVERERVEAYGERPALSDGGGTAGGDGGERGVGVHASR